LHEPSIITIVYTRPSVRRQGLRRRQLNAFAYGERRTGALDFAKAGALVKELLR